MVNLLRRISMLPIDPDVLVGSVGVVLIHEERLVFYGVVVRVRRPGIAKLKGLHGLDELAVDLVHELLSLCVVERLRLLQVKSV